MKPEEWQQLVESKRDDSKPYGGFKPDRVVGVFSKTRPADHWRGEDPYERSGLFRRKRRMVTEWQTVFTTDVAGLLLLVHHDGTLEYSDLVPKPPPGTIYVLGPWEHMTPELKEVLLPMMPPDIKTMLLALEER